MKRILRLLRLFCSVSLQNEAAYRLDFLIKLVGAVINLGGELLTLWAIFSNTRSLAGWGPYEVIVLLGVFRIMVGVVGAVIGPNMRAMMEDIRSGKLDHVLVKPISAQFYVSFRNWAFFRAFDAVAGLLLVIVGGVMLSARVSLASLALFVLMLAAGAVIIYSFWLILATTTFWFTRLANIEMVFWNVFHAGRYPLDVYNPWMRWLLTFILPLAFLTTFPAEALLGRAGGATLLASALVAPLMLIVATLFWRYGVSRYSGASA
ncbi:MAG: ABC-2 family transporter protein [Planctomycetes bacterium]|nr:ABC-2 family transporter protein [Planctomycetota bacterium]